jgi:sigma-B regulation protein RsbU (phosphoserine phosphatase)
LIHSSVATRLQSLVAPAGIAPEVPILQETISVAPGDLLLIYSDGIPEACNPREEEFGEARLSRLVRGSRYLPAAELCAAILDSVKDFSRGVHQADDLTVVAAKFFREG